MRTAVVTGLGEFIAREAAQAEGLDVVSLARRTRARTHPVTRLRQRWRCSCVVSAFRRTVIFRLKPDTTSAETSISSSKSAEGFSPRPNHLDPVLTSIVDVARTRRVLVVPGGGPFADAVRDIDGRLGIGDDAAHWMAILGMDQYAHLLASRLSRRPSLFLVRDRDRSVHTRGAASNACAVTLACRCDPLPHTWEVTSDSIAAWVAGEAAGVPSHPGQAARSTKVLMLVDAHFEQRAAGRHEVRLPCGG